MRCENLFKKASNKIILFFAVLAMMSLGSNGKAFAEEQLNMSAESAILADADSGRILFQKNPDELLPPASMTKMMTEYIILESVKQGKISWNQKISISEYAHNVSQKRSLSNVPLRIDDQYSIKELFEATAIYSANGAAIALAETLGGTEENFVKMMNEKAAAMGLKDYKFINCTGLNSSDLVGLNPNASATDEENLISARSAAMIAYRLLQDYPEILQTSSIAKKTFREGTTDAIKMDNWNWMLPSLVYKYEGVDGLKTGSTPTAGYSFTGTAKRNGIRFITVVMKTESYKARFAETRVLLDYGFANFMKKEIIPAGYIIKDKSVLPVIKGKEKLVNVASKKPLNILIRRGEEKLYEPNFLPDKTKLSPEGALIAPVSKGQKAGYFTVKYKGASNYGYLTAEGPITDRVDAVATTSVEKANWLVLLFRWVISLVSSRMK